jgi:hypothetical protein
MSRAQDYVLETASNPGTGTVSLGGAATGRRSFAAALGAGLVYYYIDDGVQFEKGLGTLALGSPNTLARTAVLGNHLGTTALVNFTGTVRVYCEIPIERRLFLDANLRVSLAGAGVVGADATGLFPRNGQVFASSGTFTVPAGVTEVLVELVGGGGGGGGSAATNCGGGGGGGGYARKVVTGLTPGATVAVTVGAGGSVGLADAEGGTGGTSSFGAHCSATGGAGGTRGSFGGAGGAGGAGSGGDFGARGGPGVAGGTTTGWRASGGSSLLGGGSSYGGGGAGYGGGGSGSLDGTNTGAGAAGVVVVRW